MRSLAALLVTSLLLGASRIAVAQEAASPTLADTAVVALEARAQALYQEGRAHFHAGRFDEARASFAASLERYDSPNTRMYQGRALARLGRIAEAFSMLDRAARDAEVRARSEPRYDATRAAARAEADALRPSLAWLVVEVSPAPDDLAVSLDGAALQRGVAGVELPFMPGRVRVLARASGYEPAEAAVDLAEGEHRALRLTLRLVVRAAVDAGAPRATADAGGVTVTRRGPVRTTGAVIGLAGLASLAAGLAFGLVAWDQYQTVLGDPTQRDTAAAGIGNRDAANSLLATGGVLTAAGALLYFFAPARAESSPAARLSVGVGGVGVEGRF